MRFDAPQPGQTAPAAKPADHPAFALPEGLPFRLAFTQALPFRTIAAGDVIPAKFAVAIQDASKQMLVPAGTPVKVRVLEVDFTLARGQTGLAGNSDVNAWIHDPDVAPLLLAPNTAILKFYGVKPDFILKAGHQSKWRSGGTGPTPGCLTSTSSCK